MSENNENTEQVVDVSVSTDETRKKRRVVKCEITSEQVLALTSGLDSYEKDNFYVRGYKRGHRVVFTKTPKISRFYYYGAGDYDSLNSLPEKSSLIVYSEDERREKKLGGIMAEVDLGNASTESALTLINALINLVREAPVPKPAPVKTKKNTEVSENVTEETFSDA